jgi:hypothetical protein
MNNIKSFPAKAGGFPLRKVSEYHLYELAIAIHPLTNILDDVKYTNVWMDWIGSRSALENLFQQRQLEFCYEAANKLYAAINNVVPTDWEEIAKKIPDKPEDEKPLTWSQRHGVTNAAKEFETVLRTELNNADTYFIDPKGTHKTSVLLVDASREIPENVLKEAPDIAEDFRQAGRCLLFDNSTAVGFHLMRAIESVIYAYMKKLTGKEMPIKSRNWGAYLRVLKANDANKKVMGVIEHIKDTYRNPILHPEVTLSPDEAQVLFGLSVSAIVLIVNAMKASHGATLAFPAAGAIALP